MKRPFAVVGLTYLIAQTIAVLCGFTVTAVLFCVAAACALFVFVRVKSRPEWLLPVLLSCVVSFGLTGGYMLFRVEPAKAIEGQNAYIVGRVCEAPCESYGRIYYIIETDVISLEGVPQSVRFRLSSGKSLGAQYGDTVRTMVQFNYMKSDSGTARRLLSDGVVLTAYLPYDSDTEITKGERTLYGGIISLRDNFSAAADRLMGDELGGMLTGMLTGDTSGIDSRLLDDFRACGLSHLFAVSGMHLSILVSALTLLFRRITANYRITSLMTLPFVVFLMAFSGFSMSIRRAGIMMILYLCAQVFRREADTVNSLGLSALAVCLVNPFAAGDVGLLMSCCCTFGLAVLLDPAERKLFSLIGFDPKSRTAFILRPIISTVISAGVSALSVFPITVLCFGEVSLVGPIVNALCAYPISCFIILGTAAAAFSCIPLVGSIIGFVLLIPTWMCGQLSVLLAEICSELPGAGVLMNYPFMAMFLVIAAVLLLFWYFTFCRNGEKTRSLFTCSLLVAAVLASGTVTYGAIDAARESITVFNASDGVMTALICGGRCVIIGAGGENYHGWLALEGLSERNIDSVEVIVLPDNTDTYASNAAELIERFEPETVYLSDEGSTYELLLRSCGEIGAQTESIDDACCTVKGGELSFETFSDDNGVLWVWAECGSLSMLVIPSGGDCALLPERFGRPDIAVLSSENVINITCISPTAVIVSAEGKAGAHISAVLGYRGVKTIFQTPHDGFITVTESGNGIRVEEQ